VGASLLAKASFATPIKRVLAQLFKAARHSAKPPTIPCAAAYACARIRRLVRLGGGFYCGAVADESAIGFSDPTHYRRTNAQSQLHFSICT